MENSKTFWRFLEWNGVFIKNIKNCKLASYHCALCRTRNRSIYSKNTARLVQFQSWWMRHFNSWIQIELLRINAGFFQMKKKIWKFQFPINWNFRNPFVYQVQILFQLLFSRPLVLLFRRNCFCGIATYWDIVGKKRISNSATQ